MTGVKIFHLNLHYSQNGSTKNFVGIYNFEIKNIQRYINRLFMKKN